MKVCVVACSVGSSQIGVLGTINTIQYRSGQHNSISNNDVFMVFHRLAIMDMTKTINLCIGLRPDLVLMCNGKINHHILIQNTV